MRYLFPVLICFLAATAAHAGNTVLQKGQSKLKLVCDSPGCFATVYTGAKAGKRVRLGEGGSENYRKWKAKYQAQGWR